MRFLFLCLMLASTAHFAHAQNAPQLQPLTPTQRVWQRSEWVLSGIDNPDANPFDPDQIAIDATFTSPTGKIQKIAAFWMQDFTRTKGENDKEILSDKGAGQWRLRWTPTEIGTHRIAIIVSRQGKAAQRAASTCSVQAAAKNARGFARVGQNQRYFRTDNGAPLPLIGENLCWPDVNRGTYDYDKWLPAMQNARMNYGRLWMWHNSFGAEFYGNERLNYNQKRLWQLDYTLDEANQRGIYMMLCLDYHGIFQTEPDMWGGNAFWYQHAYQKKNGGPCEVPNDFFTMPAAQELYRKRLRYIVARFGADTNILSWQFFNEINNVYGDGPLKLKPADVVSWHAKMSEYLRGIDPYQHLQTSSLGSDGRQDALWQLPGMDYAMYHWYGNWGGAYSEVTHMTDDIAATYHQKFNKPMYVGEFGTDGSGANSQSDPHRRGLRQALWGGIFSGSAGTAMPWWWENIHDENLYPFWRSLRDFLPDDFGNEKWQPLGTQRPAQDAVLGAIKAGGQAFSEPIALRDQWGGTPRGALTINASGDGGNSSLNGFVHGTDKPDLQRPFRILAQLSAGAKLVLHLNSVANGPILRVRQNGRELLKRELLNKDGGYERNKEYDEDIVIPLQAGRADIEVDNVGADWLFLDWARLEGALPTQLATDQIQLETHLMGDGRKYLLWLLDNRFVWPRGALSGDQLVRGATVELPEIKAGTYQVRWWNTKNGQQLKRAQAKVINGKLSLPIVDFAGDVAAILEPLN